MSQICLTDSVVVSNTRTHFLHPNMKMVEMNLTFVNFELSRSFNPWRLGGANTYSLNKSIPHILFITKFQFLFNFFWHNQIHTFLTPFWFHLPEYIEKVKKSTEWVQQSNWTIDIGLAISAAIDNDWCWQPGQMGAMCDQIYSGIDANGKFSIISAFESYFRFFFSSSNQISLEILTFFLF